MICSSLNLDLFIIRLLRWDGFYFKVEEETGLRTGSKSLNDGWTTDGGKGFVTNGVEALKLSGTSVSSAGDAR